MSPERQSVLIAFAEEHFVDLPAKCLSEFKNQNKLPGKGQVVSEDDITSLTLRLSLSLEKSYGLHMQSGDDICSQLSELFTEEYLINLNEFFLEIITVKESAVITSLEKLLKYCKMEKDPIIIVSPVVANILEKHRSFIANVTDEPDIDYLNFYEFGKIRNVKIVVDPLQINESYAYLISGNVIDYTIKENSDEETFINYKLSPDGNDLIALFKPVTVYYRVDTTGLNFKFFILNDEIS